MLQNTREILRVQGRLKDMGDHLQVLEQAIQSVHFVATDWKVKPSDWYEVSSAVIQVWPNGSPKVYILEKRLRAVDIRLQRLASAPMENEAFHEEKARLKGFIIETQPAVREIWDGLMDTAVAQNADQKPA